MKYKKIVLKRLLGGILATVLTFSLVPSMAFGATTYHKNVTQETVTRGVVYEKSSRMTDAGIQNVHTLTVDLTESTLEFKEVESAVEYGLKETAKKLLTDNGALAGVNSDFFGMSGTHSASFGPVLKDGELVSAGASINKEKDEYASFFMDQSGASLFTYFKMSASFANSQKTLELASINKVTSMVFPIYFDQQAADSTADLDKRFEGLVKFRVENDMITYISQPGETVAVPEGGYLIVMSKDYRNNAAPLFQLYDPVVLTVSPSIDLTNMENGFSGGGKLLIAGGEAPATHIVAAGRQPRTAFGVSQDGKKAIFMVIDGRGDSVGATHAETAVLMKEYGAYEAMHMDGGGSTTMVAQTLEDPNMVVKNTVSDGGERKVINTVGIFQTAEKGEVAEIRVVPSMTRTLPNKATAVSVYGLDEYYNRIEIPVEEVTLTATGVEGTWSGFTFTPTQTGSFTVTAIYGDMNAVSTPVVSAVTSKVKPTTSINLGKAGETATIATQVLDTDGFSHWVSSTTAYAVADPSVGTLNNNVFTATKAGATYITCTRDGQTAYIPVTVGGAKAVATPNATVAADPKKQTVTKAEDGAFYLNIIGKVAYSGSHKINESTYADARTKARNAVDANAEVAIYGGTNDVKTTPKLDTLSWNGSYRFLNRSGTSLAMVTAAKGGIRATDPNQWAKLTADLELATENNTIILVMDKTPSDFTSQSEATYLRVILNKYVQQGKDVFVVSSSGVGQWTSVKDGVRYVNLPDLWKADGSVNSNFSMLKLRINGTEVSYEVVKV